MPILTVHDVGQAAPLARALVDGGVFAFEVLLRTPVACDVVREMRAAAPEAAKPKARDIQRFLAIAANMVGDELEEGVTAAPVTTVAGRREVADAVLTRDQLKRATASKVMLAELRAEFVKKS